MRRAVVAASLTAILTIVWTTGVNAQPTFGDKGDCGKSVYRIPINLSGHRILLNTKLNGRRITGQYDTGATVALVPPELIGRFQLQPSNPVNISASGAPGVATPSFGGTFDFDGYAVSGRRIVAGKNAQGDKDIALLGFAIFGERISYIGVDFDAHRLEIGLAGCVRLPNVSGYEALPIVMRGENPFVPVQINGHTLQAVFDTGSNSTFLNENDAAAVGIPEGAYDEQDVSKLINGLIGKHRVAEIDELNFGGLETTGTKKIDVTNAGMSVIGMDLLEKFNFYIDATHAQVLLKERSQRRP